jgi:hypothetical protein
VTLTHGTLCILMFLYIRWILLNNFTAIIHKYSFVCLTASCATGPRCDIFKQASEMASHVPCECEALGMLRFRNKGLYMTRWLWWQRLSARYCTLFKVRGCWMNKLKGWVKRSILVEVHGSLFCPPFSILLYSAGHSDITNVCYWNVILRNEPTPALNPLTADLHVNS